MRRRLAFITATILIATGGCGTDSFFDDPPTNEVAGSGGEMSGGGEAGASASQAGAGDDASGGTDGSGDASGGAANSPAGGASSGGEAGRGGEVEPGGEGGGREAGGGGDTGLGGAAAASGGDTGLGGAAAGSGGDSATVSPVSSVIKKSITKQLMPVHENEPVVIEVGTVSFYPVILTNPTATVPEGWVLSHVEEQPGNCPYTSGMDQKCLQLFQVHMYPDASTCQLASDQIHWSWDVACAPGGACAAMPPDLTSPVTFTTKHSSEYFCEQAIDFDPFLPHSALLLPVLGTGPVTLRLFTTLQHPYEFSAGSASVPDGLSLVSFSEDLSLRACNTEAFPHGCRQWWNVVVDTGSACSASGSYRFSWDVSCKPGGNCDPAIETYSRPLNLHHQGDLCQH